jgi:hypothetical protein
MTTELTGKQIKQILTKIERLKVVTLSLKRSSHFPKPDIEEPKHFEILWKCQDIMMIVNPDGEYNLDE